MEELTEQQIREKESRFIVKITDKNNNKVQEKWITTKDIHSELEDREDLKKHKEVCYNDGVWSTKQKDDNGRINRTTEKRD